mgnify:CR=1 FL=1
MTFSLLDGTTQMVLMGIFMYVFLIGVPQLIERIALKKEKKCVLYSNVLQYS